jgi:hypothetical protein
MTQWGGPSSFDYAHFVRSAQDDTSGFALDDMANVRGAVNVGAAERLFIYSMTVA